jgi:nitrogen regulatory protein P-II 2
MHTQSLRLVTIITERILQDQLLDEIRELGAKGYTLSEVRGEGSRGVRAHEWEGRDAKIEAVVSPEVADRIVDHIAKQYFAYHAVIVYVQTVDVVRGEKYI